MNIKQSRYNILIDELINGDKLIYNSFNGTFGKMNKITQNKILKIKNKQKVDIHDYDIKVMIEQGFLIDEDIDELELTKIKKLKSQYDEKGLSLTIAPTLNCNMDCPYCYEDKKNLTMNDETKDSIIRFIKGKENIEYLYIVWYGGEPLLQLDTIKDLSERIISFCDEKKIVYKSIIITNGILLDRKTAKILKEECKVSMAQITIDGLKETHNKRRHLKNNGDSFEIITSNIDNIKDLIRVNIRVNVDKNNTQEANSLIDYFINGKNWSNKNVNFYFSPVHDITEACTSHASTCYTFEEFANINKYLLTNRYKLLDDNNFSINIPKPISLSCGAIMENNYLIDPRGDLFKCWNQIGMKEYSVGNINEKVRFNNEHNKWLLDEYNEKCEKCKNLPICQGGCPYNKRLNNNESICSHDMLNYKEIMKEFYQEMVKGKARIV